MEYNLDGNQIWVNSFQQDENGYLYFGFSILLSSGNGYSFPMGRINKDFVEAHKDKSEDKMLEIFFSNLALVYLAKEKKELEDLNICYQEMGLEQVINI